jgi:hypothetical protein
MHHKLTTLEYMAMRPSLPILSGMLIMLTSTPGIFIFIIKTNDISGCPTGLSGCPSWLFITFLFVFSLLFVVGVTMIFWGLRNAANPGSALYRLTRLKLVR